MLFLAALLLTGRSLGDLYGRREIFAAGVVLFTVASAWCGLALNIGQLIVARGLQGIGGALLIPICRLSHRIVGGGGAALRHKNEKPICCHS